MIGFVNRRDRVLEYEQKLVSNSSSGQRLSPHHIFVIILKVAAATDTCGGGLLRKRIWFGKNNTNCLSHFFFAAKLYSKPTFVRMLLPNMFTEL